MTNPSTSLPNMPVSEIMEGVERRRRWSPEEKLRIVEETDEPGRSVSLVARRYGLAPNQVEMGVRPSKKKKLPVLLCNYD